MTCSKRGLQKVLRDPNFASFEGQDGGKILGIKSKHRMWHAKNDHPDYRIKQKFGLG